MVDLDTPPAPRPDAETAPYWEATAEGRMVLGRCRECRRWLHPPREACPTCAGPVGFEAVSGRGTVFSFITVHQPTVPGYLRELPYSAALVEIDEQPGVRLPARLAGGAGAHVQIGDRVTLELAELAGSDYRVPVARPVADDIGADSA